MQSTHQDSRLSTVIVIDSAAKTWRVLIVDLNYAQFADAVGCDPGEHLAADFVVHKLFERGENLSKAEFDKQALRSRWRMKCWPDVYVVKHGGHDYISMVLKKQQIIATANVPFPDFVRRRLLGLPPGLAQSTPWADDGQTRASGKDHVILPDHWLQADSPQSLEECARLEALFSAASQTGDSTKTVAEDVNACTKSGDLFQETHGQEAQAVASSGTAVATGAPDRRDSSHAAPLAPVAQGTAMPMAHGTCSLTVGAPHRAANDTGGACEAGSVPGGRGSSGGGAHRRTGSKVGSVSGRTTVDSIACWAGPGDAEAGSERGSDGGPAPAVAHAGARGQFTFCEPRHAPQRRETDVSLAEWTLRRGTRDDDDDEEDERGARGYLDVPAADADAWWETPFEFCGAAAACGADACGAGACGACAASGAVNATVIGGPAEARDTVKISRRRPWWRQAPRVRWGVALAAFAAGFSFASAVGRRLGSAAARR